MAAHKGNKYACKYTEKQMKKLCDELRTWAYSSNAIHLTTFAYEKLKRTKPYLYMLAEHYPEMKEALEDARQILAQKIVNSCYNSNDKESVVNASFGEKYLPIYDEEYKALLEWKALIGKEKNNDALKDIGSILQYINDQKNGK